MNYQSHRFFEEKKPELIQLVESYLKGLVTLNDIANYAWRVIDAWDDIGDISKSEPYAKGEKAFWAIIWAAPHLAGEEPECLARQEITDLLQIFKEKGNLPKGVDARRP